MKEMSFDNTQNSSEDEILTLIASEISAQESGVSIMNPDKLEMIATVRDAVKASVSGKGVKVTHELNAPYVSMGSVSVLGKEIKIVNTKLFTMAVMLASNFEVYTKVDGKVQMDLTFHNITRKVGK